MKYNVRLPNVIQCTLAECDKAIMVQNMTVEAGPHRAYPFVSGAKEAQEHPASRSDCMDGGDDGYQFDCSIVVQCVRPFRIHHVDRLWLLHFGFRRSEVEGRSMRVCFGPETDTDDIDALLCEVSDNPAAQELGIWSRVKLYDKSGDMHCMLLQVRLEPIDADSNSATPRSPRMARVLMRRSEGLGIHSPELSNSNPAMVNISAEEPYLAMHPNQAFLDQYQISLAEFLARGIGTIWGPGTDGNRWKNLIKQALGGAIKTCTLSTYTSDGDEIFVNVTMKPCERGERDHEGCSSGCSATATSLQPRQLVASFVKIASLEDEFQDEFQGRRQCHSPALSYSSVGSRFNRKSSTGENSPRGSFALLDPWQGCFSQGSSPRATPDYGKSKDGHRELSTLRATLKAMRRHRGACHNTDDLEDALRLTDKKQRFSLTTGSHSRTYTFGGRKQRTDRTGYEKA